jgi:uncharacterized Ntn-hydrolase superfamily protein
MTRLRPATYSLVACDRERGEWGVGVQSKFLAVGSLVSWAEAEVGAIATQAFANPTYGPDGLALLREGASAEETVERLTQADEGRDERQLGVVDAHGGSASFTGGGCFAWAGGRTGRDYAAQGNILVSEATVDALAEIFEATPGRPLAERLIAALAAAQEAGGDRRGQQSAALLVVKKGGGYAGMSDVLIDLRVDDHPTPIGELERLYRLHQLYFGQTPKEEWVPVDGELGEEIEERLARLGYDTADVKAAFREWVGTENLEDRAPELGERIDPVVLDELRKR